MGNLINIPKVQVDSTSTLKDYPRLINQLQQSIIDAFNKLQSTVTGLTNSEGYLAVRGGPVDFPATGTWGNANSLNLTPGTWDVTLVVAGNPNSATLTFNTYRAAISMQVGASPTDFTVGDNLVDFPINSATNTFSEGGSIANWRTTVNVTTPVYAKVNCTYSGGNPQYYYRFSAVQVA